MFLDGLELLETWKSMRRTKWKWIELIVFHGSIEIISLCIMEKSPISYHLTDHLNMPLISKQERNPLGDLSMLSQKESYQYSRNTSKKCSTRERSAQVSHPQVHLFSSFQCLKAEALDCAQSILESKELQLWIEDRCLWWTNFDLGFRVLGSLPRSTLRLHYTSSESQKETSGRQHFVHNMAYMTILWSHLVLQMSQLGSKMPWTQSLETWLIEDASSIWTTSWSIQKQTKIIPK